MARPTLCVGYTYFNEGEMLTHSIETLLSGRDGPEAILIYDDASSDPAQRHVPADLRIRVYRGSENRGPAFGRNALLSACTCDYIHFHDSDDYFHPDWCSSIRELISTSNPDVVLTDVMPVLDGRDMGWRIFGGAIPEDLLRFCIENSLLVPCSTLRREVLVQVGGYPTHLHQAEDYLFSLMLMARRPRVAFDPRAQVVVRRRMDSRSAEETSVLADCTNALRLAKSVVPEEYFVFMARRAVANGRRQIFLGDKSSARQSFALASELDPSAAKYGMQPKHYQLVANSLGPIAAERLATVWHQARSTLHSARLARGARL